MTRTLEPQLVGNDELVRLLDTAAASTRKRAHLLLHADHQDQVQRLLIGLEPATYVRPHVHSEQWEMIVLLRGCSLLSPLLQIAVNTGMSRQFLRGRHRPWRPDWTVGCEPVSALIAC
jgi:hypothetical protein